MNRPLTSFCYLSSPSQLNAEAGQVLIAWGRKRGYSVIPKSVTPSRIESNFQQIKLSDEDFKTVSDFIVQHGGHHRFNIPINYKPVSVIWVGCLIDDLSLITSTILQSWDINVFHEDPELKAKHQVETCL
jgi:L-glyceraldehyde reductase